MSKEIALKSVERKEEGASWNMGEIGRMLIAKEEFFIGGQRISCSVSCKSCYKMYDECFDDVCPFCYATNKQNKRKKSPRRLMSAVREEIASMRVDNGLATSHLHPIRRMEK